MDTTARRSRKRRFAGRSLAALAAGALVLSACGGGSEASSGPPDSVTIAYQPGISYAPLIMMKHEKALEEAFPETTFTWKVLSSGAAIQDGVISGEIQVGAGGVGPLILGWAKGVNWRYLAPMNTADLWLMAKESRIQSLEDFKPDDKIAMPSPTSIQSVILRKAAAEQLGDPKALDSNIVSFAHPDGLQALLSGQIAGHLTSPPFEFQEEEEGARAIVRSSDLFGDHTFNGVLMTDEYYNENQEFAQKFYELMQQAVERINEDPAAAAEILSEDAGGTPTAEEFEEYINNDAISYTTTPSGLMEFATFMQETGMVDKAPESWKDLVFPPVQQLDGS